MDPMIEVAGLSVVLPPATVALQGIDLAVRAGEFVVILGKSGAGKTTFLRSINRLVEPTASLDPQLTTSIMDILKAINVERELTLVVSQHQLETALAYATRIIGFRRGRIAFDGPPQALTPAVIDAIYGDGEAG